MDDELYEIGYRDGQQNASDERLARILALCRDHRGMSAHMLSEEIAFVLGVDLRAESRSRDDA